MLHSLSGTAGTVVVEENQSRVIPKGVRLAALGILGGALAVSAWLSGGGNWFPGPEKPEPVSLSVPAALLAVPPADLPAAVRDRYRLRPDRRLLGAVAAVHRLRTGKAPEPVRAEFQNDRWRIFAGNDELFVLSEFPSFEDATDLLARWASRLPQAAASGAPAVPDTAGVEQALRAVDAEALLRALAALQGSATDVQRDPAKVRAIASGLAWLSTMTVDELEQADPLLAEAWAWVVIQRTLSPAGGAESEVLVARALGYEAAAARASLALPENNPVRLYALGAADLLAAVCAQPPAGRPCHFLHLALLREREQEERFEAALLASPFKGETNLTVRGLEMPSGLNSGRSLAELALRAVSLDTADTAGSDLEPASVEARTRDFEAAVEKFGAGYRSNGPIDVAAARAGYRASFYSGLFQEAREVVEHFASGPAAKALAASIESPAAGTADDLRHWVAVNAETLDGATDPRPLAEVMVLAQSIGAAPLFQLNNDLSRQVESTHPLRRLPLPALFARMDTRPSHREMAARMASLSLNSPWLYEKLARAAAEAAPHQSEELPALVAEMNEDTVRLREIVDDPAMPSYAQIVAIAALSEIGRTNDAFVRARYEAIAADPDEGTRPLVAFLEKRNDFAGAIAALDAALQRSNRYGELGRASLLTEKARLQLRMGDPERAFATIKPVIAVGKEDTLLQAARIELARHRAEHALELAQLTMARYPENSSETSGLIAAARWQLGDYTTAAKELAASRNGIVGDWNRYLPEAFAETFAKAPEDEIREAFSELVAAGIPPRVLARVAQKLGKTRDLGIVLPLIEGLRDPAPEWQTEIQLSTYDLIREKQGEAAALAWIDKQVAVRPSGMALHLYQTRKYELLLGLFPQGAESEKPDLIRMVKAAALLHLGETSGPRWEELTAQVAQDAGNGFFTRGARYLLGQADAATVLQPATDTGYLASIGWIMGVKAASERRFADADGWFQVALESGAQQQPPHAWSWVIESDWLQSERSLEILQKTGQIQVSPARARATP